MKHIKPYNIFENSQEPEHPGFPTTEEEIHKICKKYGIDNYTINDDLSIDVNEGVDLIARYLKFLPLNFNYVSGFFNCEDNNLTSLEGVPKTIGGDFICSSNKLTTLNSDLETVSGFFHCYNNKLLSLEYLPSGIDYKHEYTTFEKNPIYTLINTFIRKDNAMDLVQEFNEYSIVREDTVVFNRLKAFISDFDLDMPDLDEVKKYYKIV